MTLEVRTNKKKNWRRHVGFNGQNTSTNSRGAWLVNTTARFDAPIKSVEKIICYGGTLKKKVYRVLLRRNHSWTKSETGKGTRECESIIE